MPPILLIAGLVFEVDMPMADQLPGVGEDFEAMRAFYVRVRALRER